MCFRLIANRGWNRLQVSCSSTASWNNHDSPGTNCKEIGDCAADISKYYDDLISFNVRWNGGQAHYDHKKALWLCLNAVNALEGVRFYVSFACSWAFAEVKKMEGNAKIIKLMLMLLLLLCV